MKKKTLITLLITLALITSNLSAVFADDGAAPAPEGETQQGEPVAAEQPAQEPAQEEVVSSETELVVEEVESNPLDEAQTEESDYTLAEVVEILSAENVEVVSDQGEVLPLASEEAAQILASTDPFFWDSVNSKWVGYTVDGTGCPANVECNASPTPFQAAVTAAGAGNTVYVASGSYAEDVIINSANQSLIAFYDVTVPDAALPNITINSSGYAVVQSITLNVALALNDGVYADMVIVNQPGQTGGRLDDAMELVSGGGRIEADVVIYGADGHYRVRDKNHADVNFEWECGEPNVLIYPGRTYRMTLMRPLDPTIVDYYETHGDERNIAPWNLDLSALERIEDLRIAVNVSEDFGNWSHANEERIYWYLLGNTGIDAHNNPINLNNSQETWANQITNGDWDDVTRFWDVWFMYPIKENNNTNISAANRQLTFLVYDPRPVLGCIDPLAENYDPNADTDDQSCVYRMGCMDPAALNYDPNAIMDDESCRYPSNTNTPPQFIPGALPIPVTGDFDVLIPVTGMDMNTTSLGLADVAIALSSMLVIAFSMIIFGKKKVI